MAIDISRLTSGVTLPTAVSQDIWQKTIEESAVMRLANRIDLPGAGLTVPTITGDPVAEWVSETDEKPVSRPTLGSKNLRGYTLAVIVPFSNQFRRDLPSLYNAAVQRLPGALGRKFDSTVFGTTAPGSDFDTLGGAAAVGIAGNTYKGLVAADAAVGAAGGSVTGWAVAPQGRSLLLSSVDSLGRPLFTGSIAEGNVPTILGAPVYTTKGVYRAATPNQIGFAGDWTGATYGVVEDVQLSISTEATLTDGDDTINLWQRNMFAVRAEIEIGFRVRDLAEFVKLTDATQA